MISGREQNGKAGGATRPGMLASGPEVSNL